MTVEEIKQTYSMRDVLDMYHVQVNRSGMCCCPIHGEKHPSMKIYEDSFNCFACGANGDIFTFVQKMENCDFKGAFYILGGSYDGDHRKARIAQYHAQKARENKKREEQKRKQRQMDIYSEMTKGREGMKNANPLSDDWWDALATEQNAIIKDYNMEGGANE